MKTNEKHLHLLFEILAAVLFGLMVVSIAFIPMTLCREAFGGDCITFSLTEEASWYPSLALAPIAGGLAAVIAWHKLDIHAVFGFSIVLALAAVSAVLGGRGLFTLLSTSQDDFPAMLQALVVFFGVVVVAEVALWLARRTTVSSAA